jgi:hypothetical protein
MFVPMSTAASGASRSIVLDPDSQRVIEEQRARRLRRLARRELWSYVVFAGGFAAAVALLAAFFPSERDPTFLTVLLLVVAYAAAFRLDFEIGTGSAVPTELILVPMLFLLPVGLVPLAVAAGVVLGSLDEYARGSLSLVRVPMRVVIAWHAVGPALVLGLAGEPSPQLSDWPLYLAALLSQFLVDTLWAAGREWLALGVRPSVQLRALGVRDRHGPGSSRSCRRVRIGVVALRRRPGASPRRPAVGLRARAAGADRPRARAA